MNSINHTIKYMAVLLGLLLPIGILAQTAGPGLYFDPPATTVNETEPFVLYNTSSGVPAGTTFTWEFEYGYDNGYEVSPEPAIIYQTDQSVPVTFTYAIPGEFNVTLKAPGFDDITKTIIVKAIIPNGCGPYLVGYVYPACEQVTNGGFNDYNTGTESVPINPYNATIRNICPWGVTPQSVNPNNPAYPAWQWAFGTADMYNTLVTTSGNSVPTNLPGYQAPYEGTGYAGFMALSGSGNREYFAAPLRQTLQGGQTYNVKFKVSLAEGSNRAVKVGACLVSTLGSSQFSMPPGFSAGDVVTIDPAKCIIASADITDKVNWTQIAGTLPVDINAPASYIMIGHFNNESNVATTVSADAAYPTLVNQSQMAAYYYVDAVSVTPTAYCHCPATKSFGTDINSVTYTSQLNLSSGQSASIMGNLIVNTPTYQLNNINLKFGPGSKLTVPTGTVLKLTGGTVLEACTSMWDGIYCDGEIVLNQATVRDAQSALNFVATSKWSIQESVLENNRRHMYVNGGTTFPSFPSNLMRSNRFSCNPAQMKAPYAGQYTQYAIELLNIRDISIGVAGAIAYQNKISDAYRGISAKNVYTLNIYNNSFENLKCQAPPGTACGQGTDLNVAIYAEGDAIAAAPTKINVGITSDPSGRNVFNNCTGGVYAKGNTYLSGNGNILTNIRDNGFYSTGANATNNGVFLYENNIKHAKTGIYVYNAGNKPVWAVSNTISKESDYKSVPVTYGIRIENPALSTTTYTVFANNNIITRYASGINIKLVTLPQAMTNTIYTNATLTDYPEGIRIDQCPQANIESNTFYEQSTPGQSMGVRVESSSANTTLCNTTNASHIGLFFGGDQPASTVAGNYLNNGKTGIYLNWGNIGLQGTAKVPNLNAWTGNTWNSHFLSYGDVNTGATSRFNLKYYGSMYYPTNLTRAVGGTALQVPIMVVPNADPNPAYVTNCRVIDQGLQGLQEKSTSVSQMATDTLVGDSALYKEEMEWSRKLALYRSVKHDDSRLLAPELYAYAKSEEAQNIGKFDAARTLALDGNAKQALDVLNSVSPRLEIEEKMKDVYGIAFRKMAEPEIAWEYSADEYSVLEQLAAECPYKYGEAVYTARTLLYAVNPDAIFANVCENVEWNTERVDMPSATEKANTAQVYPNPSTDDFMVMFNNPEDAAKAEVTITDMQGRVRGIYRAQGSGTVSLSGQNLESGIYVCIIKVNGEVRETKKLEKL